MCDEKCLDAVFGEDGCSHMFDFSQEHRTVVRYLNVRIWFVTITIFSSAGSGIPLDRFTANGARWYDALRRGGLQPDELESDANVEVSLCSEAIE